MIRTISIGDAEDVAAIYNYYILHTDATFEVVPLSVAEMQQRIADISHAYPYYVYEADGMVAGYCYAHAWKQRAAYKNTLETAVYLHPSHTGKGIGTQLMQTLIDECRRQGYHALIANITACNDASCALHERLGFTQVSRFKEVGHKFGKWLDVVDYELQL